MNIRQSKINQGLPLEASDFYEDNYLCFTHEHWSLVIWNVGECFKDYFPVKIGGKIKINKKWYKIVYVKTNEPAGVQYKIVRYPWYKRIFGL